ncbi:esterase [Sphaerisporangium siamense]|uniref:S-formylglutathione hydrolase FrmB n=1 Tax=Sphaerisporangium siamense TaxID=795645 RepID=A0A7W7DER9_9ACTN|nr:alpha/beta hydrolase-fold protein [Sphaerisporangium siamense]MBB4705462.1 S-formylglutathione hydrolase FrmB [Sphaerisporangium siamense]GII86386.1 esterase [Sphaerisporangium siamense]
MGLTSIKLELLVGLLAVVGLVASVWWIWPRLSARTWPAVAGRLAVLLGNQVLTLATLGLVLNNYFGFYGTWEDLLGTAGGPTSPIVADPVAPGAQAPALEPTGGVQVIGTTHVPLASGGRSDAGGRLQEVVISGARSRLSSPAFVYLPPQYFDEKYASTRFPVIVALTGYPGDARNLVTRMNMPFVAAKAIAGNEMIPTIMVLMRPTVAPPRDTECVDVPRGPQAETYFTKDLKDAMASGFRVGTDAASWGILGASTGGYCALKISMRHPEAYAAAVSLSGYLRPPIDATTGDLFGGSRRLMRENDMMWRLTHLPHPPISVLLSSSQKGESNYKMTLEFLAAVRPPMRASSLILPSGGHNFNTWSREVPQALPWLARQLRVPAPDVPVQPAPSPSS